MKKIIFAFLLLILSFAWLGAQDTSFTGIMNKALRIYLDCPSCDMDYIRTEIPFVNYVRDRKEAQVHILITSQQTGSGGKEYTVVFIGKENFRGQNDTLRTTTNKITTNDEIRKKITQEIKLGLVHYVAKTPLAEKLKINFTLPRKEVGKVKDPWNNWVFSLQLSSYASGEKSSNQIYLNGSFSASKVTKDWKFRISSSASYSENNFKIADVTISSYSRSHGFYSQIVKSLTNHWSAALNGSVNSSSYLNIDRLILFEPAVEYNIFPYSESTHKQLTIQYSLADVYYDYMEKTIYNKTKENLFRQSLNISLILYQPWGSTSTTLSGSQFLHDLSKNNINLFNRLSLKLFKGFSFTITGSVSAIHDQLSLPRSGATQEEVLLRRKELSTTYSYFISMGIRYTFGSIYNNIVNPRFRGGSSNYTFYF